MEGEAVVLEGVLPVLDGQDEVLVGGVGPVRRARPGGVQGGADLAGGVPGEQAAHGVVAGGVVVDTGWQGRGGAGDPVDADRVEAAAGGRAAGEVGERVVRERVEVGVGLDAEAAAGQAVGVAEHPGERGEVEAARSGEGFGVEALVEGGVRRVVGAGQRQQVGVRVVLGLARAVGPVRHVVDRLHVDPAAPHDGGGVVVGVPHGRLPGLSGRLAGGVGSPVRGRGAGRG